MPLSNIAIIVIRLFVLNWLLQDITLWITAFLSPLPRELPLSVIAGLYGTPAILLIFCVCLWVTVPWIARIVSRGADATVTLANLSRYDLYSFGFVFLGLFFVLSSFADVINWLHYFTTVSPGTVGADPRTQKLYQLTRPFLTLAAGLVSLLGAPRWAKKLLSYEEKPQVA